MSRWAGKNIRKQREEIVIEKHLCGWHVRDIARYVGIASGSVSYAIKTYLNRRDARSRRREV